MAMNQAMLNPDALRNFKEFIEMYNKTTESCFRQCVINLNNRDVTSEEDSCIMDCTSKHVNLNHRVLSAFMVEQPKITEKKIQEAQKEVEAARQTLEARGISTENMSPEEMAAKMMEAMPSASQ